jgi:exosortase
MDAGDHHVPAAPLAAGETFFWTEFRDCWRRAPEKGFFLALLAGWCVLFQFAGISSFNFKTLHPSLFEWLYHAWNEPAMDSSQGNLIPFVVAVLFWVKRRELAASISGAWWPGLAVVAAALLVHALGFLAQQPRVSVIALFMGMYGLIGVAWGWRTMWRSTFPMVLFVFCMPLGNFAEPVTLPLRMVSATWTRVFCQWVLGIGVVQRGTMLSNASGNFNYDVAAACSGIHSFVALLALTTIFAMLALRTWWRRALMALATFPLVVFCNVLRLVVVVLIGQAYGQACGKWVHDWFGFVTYLASIGALMVVAHWLKEKA